MTQFSHVRSDTESELKSSLVLFFPVVTETSLFSRCKGQFRITNDTATAVARICHLKTLNLNSNLRIIYGLKSSLDRQRCVAYK